MSSDWISAVASLGGAGLAGLVAQWLGFAFLRRARQGKTGLIEGSLAKHVTNPVRLLTPAFGVALARPTVRIAPWIASLIDHILVIAFAGGVAWLVVGLTYVLEDVVSSKYRLDAENNLRSRQLHTQVQVLRRVVAVVVFILALSVVLLSFPQIRAVGASLLASAGIIGIVGGLAAKPVATNVIAGIQIAITQPITVDDVVVVEGHWGRIEEIGLTYVVVRVWDLRRLVLPISYFISNPFENWTRRGADVLGWAHLYVDYLAPIDEIRRKLGEILTSSPRFDGKAWSLQVTEAGTETLQIRALMSAKDSSTSWDLQCEVRERLIAYLQSEHPEALPRLRTQPAEAPRLPGDAESVKSAPGDVTPGGGKVPPTGMPAPTA
ncbi:MAG: mechanosensitive ion channel family protein [Acidimicrobiales bacterium]